jgi:hypothetical protein
MSQADYDDIVRWGGEVGKTPTPDKLWKELRRRVPRTERAAKKSGELPKLVDYLVELHLDIEKAVGALAASDREYKELQRSYLELKILVVEIARGFGMNKNHPHSFPEHLIEELMKTARPLVVEQGTNELKGEKTTKNGIVLPWDGNEPATSEARPGENFRVELMGEFQQQGLVSQQSVLKAAGVGKAVAEPPEEKQQTCLVESIKGRWRF